jgi:hypothetical protein
VIQERIKVGVSLLFWICLFAGIPLNKTGNAQCEYWVAPEPVGNDANPGTSVQPWATLEFASETVQDDHCTVWFEPGIYQGENRLNRRFETTTTFKSKIPYKAVLINNGAVVYISGGKNIILEGFDIQHSGPGSTPLVVAMDQSDEGWSENITLRNNIIHDSYNDDLLKIYDGCKNILIERNLFFNQGDSGEQMDVNSVTDVVIQKNIFFNSFESSGRQNTNLSKQYIVIKDSNGTDDGLVGSKRIYVQKNIFLNWEGQERETIIQVGLDGKPYHEAEDVYIQNNLLIGNSGHQIGSVFGVRGAKDVFVLNNTVVGDFPALSFAFRVTIEDQNPKNENIYFVNNIWSDPTGTMGADINGDENEFSDGDITETENLVLFNNLYWNGGFEIPEGDLVSPLIDDEQKVIGDPLLDTDYENIILPVWNGTEFLSGEESINAEFNRLVNLYAKIDSISPAVGRANSTFAPIDDILSNFRFGKPDLGSFQDMNGLLIWLSWLPLIWNMR